MCRFEVEGEEGFEGKGEGEGRDGVMWFLFFVGGCRDRWMLG